MHRLPDRSIGHGHPWRKIGPEIDLMVRDSLGGISKIPSQCHAVRLHVSRGAVGLGHKEHEHPDKQQGPQHLFKEGYRRF